jgi:ribosomal protein S18 acetylase RimI-like enzyme
VYNFRPFRNSDPPQLAEMWREQPPLRGRFPAVTSALLEQLVFAKPYFDPQGLIVALSDETPVGFIQAGFGGSDDGQSLSRESGTIYMLVLRDGHREPALADELVRRAENYLRESGAQVLYAGGIRPLNAFYLGIYGGSELPGVLADDRVFVDACRRNGYREIDRVVVLQRDLATFRPPITRSQRQLRRELSIREEPSPRPTTWWSAATTGGFESTRFIAESRDGAALAEVWFWDIEPLSTGWSAPTAGMFDLFVSAERRRAGIATFLLSEAFAKLAARGVARVEAQTMQQNLPAITLYERLGFQQVDEGLVFRKDARPH